MKRIDSFLITSFIPPFVVTFFIALFVLVMQFLWVYIDDIIGKGIGFFFLVELIFYLSISLFPLALPIAVLISSVMVLGNLAEHYELSSFKSAGVPLFRIMAPLMLICFGVGLFSFTCSNYLIPIANLKFKSRLYDIRKQKPTLSLEEGVFNEDFQGTVIHIGNKKSDNVTIESVKIYEQDNSSRGIAGQIVAKSGEMYTTADKRYFVMNLYDGSQYQEPNNKRIRKDPKSFIRLSFDEWHKVYDLSEFEMNRTNEDLFKTHQSMMSIGQLSASIDSLEFKMEERVGNLALQFARHFTQFKSQKYAEGKAPKDSLVAVDIKVASDSLSDTVKVASTTKKNYSAKKAVKTTKLSNDQLKKVMADNKKKVIVKKINRDVMDQISLDRIDTLKSFTLTIPENERKKLFSRALSQIRSISSQANSTRRFLVKEKEARVKFIYELYTKFSMAVVCFIFLFIGAPMGAIVRKGGFGYPILVAIIFFMVYIVLTIMSKKLASSFTIPPILAAWMPCIILFPLGLSLSYKAMNDSKMLNMDKYVAFFSKILPGIKRAAKA